MNQLEGHGPQHSAGQRAPVFRVQLGRLHKLDAARFQEADRRIHVRHTQTQTLELLRRLHFVHHRIGLNQLPQEAAAGAAHQGPLWQNAIALLLGNQAEVKHVFVVSHPFGAAGSANVLNQPKVTHARQRRRRRVNRGNRAKVDVVDGELLPAVYKIKAAAARPPNARYVQFHGLDVTGHVPRAEVHAPRVRLEGVLHPKSHRRDHQLPIDRGAHTRVVGVGVDYQVHAALAVQHDLARAVPSHRPEAHGFKNLAQRLRAAGGVFNVLNALDAKAVGHVGHGFTVGGILGHDKPLVQ